MPVPFWKIRREITRLGTQIVELPGDLHNYVFGTRNYDRTLARQIRNYQGQLPPSDRVAIYLIFPRGGLLDSHLRSLRYLREKGFAPLVVSNLPLTEADRAKLLENAWRLLERPNFGYDFGGYRDAVLSLESALPTLERLVFLNDSTWFPLPGARDWLDDAEALEVDFAGAASNFATPRPNVEDFRTIAWSYSTGHRNFHYCSFALYLRPAAFRSPDFLRYWKELRLADKKKRTVRRGEVGFTQWALAHGFSNGCTLDVVKLDEDLTALDDARIQAIARDLVIPEDTRLRDLHARLVADPTPSRADLVALILLAVSRQGSSYALAPYAIHERGFPFLKKSPAWLSPESSEATLRLALGLEGEGAGEIVKEVNDLRGRLDAKAS